MSLALGQGGPHGPACTAGLLDQVGMRVERAAQLLHGVGIGDGQLVGLAFGHAQAVADTCARDARDQADQGDDSAAHRPGPHSA